MYFWQQLNKQKVEETFFINYLKTRSEAEFLVFCGTFFQSWLTLYEMLSKFEVLKSNFEMNFEIQICQIFLSLF